MSYNNLNYQQTIQQPVQEQIITEEVPKKLTFGQKIKAWITGKVASVIFGITTISMIYFIVNSIAKTINAIKRNEQATDCDAFKYKVLNFTNICALMILACFTLPPYFEKLIAKHKLMEKAGFV